MARRRILCYTSLMPLLPAKRHLIGSGAFMFLASMLLFQLQRAMAADQGGASNIGSLECKELCLLQPIGGVRCLNPCNNPAPLGLFEMYFNLLYPWLVGVCMGVAMLHVVFGGIQMINSGDASMKSAGANRIRGAVAGLLILIFSSMILRLINPGFYR